MHEIVVSSDHPALAGHFPDNPVVPGALLLARALECVERDAGARVVRVARAKFPAVLAPGVVARVVVAPQRANCYRVTCSGNAATFLDAAVEVAA